MGRATAKPANERVAKTLKAEPKDPPAAPDPRERVVTMRALGNIPGYAIGRQKRALRGSTFTVKAPMVDGLKGLAEVVK